MSACKRRARRLYYSDADQRGDGGAARQRDLGGRGHSNLVARERQGHDLGGRCTHYVPGQRRAGRLYYSDADQRGDGGAARQGDLGGRGYSNLVACERQGHDLGGRSTHYVQGKRRARRLYYSDTDQRGCRIERVVNGRGDRGDSSRHRGGRADVLGGTGKQSTDQRPNVTGLADLVGQHRGCERAEIGRCNIVERPARPAGVVVNENYISINAGHLTWPKTRHPDIKSFKRRRANRVIPIDRKGRERLVQHALEQRNRIGLRAAVDLRAAVGQRRGGRTQYVGRARTVLLKLDRDCLRRCFSRRSRACNSCDEVTVSNTFDRHLRREGRDEVSDRHPQVDLARDGSVLSGVRLTPFGRPCDPAFISCLCAGNHDVLIGVVCVFRIRDHFRLQLLDDGRMIVDEHGMSGVIHQASEFAHHGIARKQDTRLQRLHLKPTLALVFI